MFVVDVDVVQLLSPFARAVGLFFVGNFPRYFSSSLFVNLYNFTSDTV